jgi:hypothetical protein
MTRPICACLILCFLATNVPEVSKTTAQSAGLLRYKRSLGIMCETTLEENWRVAIRFEHCGAKISAF